MIFELWSTSSTLNAALDVFPLNVFPNMTRLTLLILLAEALHTVWVLEQPAGSIDVLPLHHRLNWLMNDVLYVPRLTFGYEISFGPSACFGHLLLYYSFFGWIVWTISGIQGRLLDVPPWCPMPQKNFDMVQ